MEPVLTFRWTRWRVRWIWTRIFIWRWTRSRRSIDSIARNKRDTSMSGGFSTTEVLLNKLFLLKFNLYFKNLFSLDVLFVNSSRYKDQRLLKHTLKTFILNFYFRAGFNPTGIIYLCELIPVDCKACCWPHRWYRPTFIDILLVHLRPLVQNMARIAESHTFVFIYLLSLQFLHFYSYVCIWHQEKLSSHTMTVMFDCMRCSFRRSDRSDSLSIDNKETLGQLQTTRLHRRNGSNNSG